MVGKYWLLCAGVFFACIGVHADVLGEGPSLEGQVLLAEVCVIDVVNAKSALKNYKFKFSLNSLKEYVETKAAYDQCVADLMALLTTPVDYKKVLSNDDVEFLVRRSLKSDGEGVVGVLLYIKHHFPGERVNIARGVRQMQNRMRDTRANSEIKDYAKKIIDDYFVEWEKDEICGVVLKKNKLVYSKTTLEEYFSSYFEDE